MELKHLVDLISELPQGNVLPYVRRSEKDVEEGKSTCTLLRIEPAEPRVYAKSNDLDKEFMWGVSFLETLASRIEVNVPYNINSLMNNSGSMRPIIDTIVAHTREFYTVKKGRAIETVWIPSKPKDHLELEEIPIYEIPAPKPKYNPKHNKAKIANYTSASLQVIYYGAPGTGKSYTIDDMTDGKNSIRTTFHPDSDYSTFVGAYKPTMAPMPVNAFVGTTVHHAKNADNEKAYEKKIVYKYVPQAFLKAYVAAWSDLDNPHFLVIEEINRGNCAQIFGDLFQLLDRNNTGSSSYAIHADEDITQFLAEDKNGFTNLSEEQKDAIRSFVLVKDSGKTEAIGDAILSGKKLLLPPNLYIWATMNTSDQSLFPIDSAFKRRWNWEYMPIDYDAMDWQFEAGGKRYLWSDFLKKMNPLIYNLTQSSDKQMGYFFAKADKKTDDAQPENNLISEKIFLNKVLFYLWTDVLKDFEAGDKIFRDEEKGQMYQFSDFFPTTNGKLAEFVGKLELPEVESAEKDNDDVDFDSPNDSELNDNNGNSQRDYSKYSVNGQGRMSKSDAVVAAMTAFVNALPELSATEILRKIDGFNLSNTIAYSEEDFNKYLEQSSDPRFTKRYARIETGTGEPIYIYKGSTPKRIGELIQGLNNSGTGVILAKVE